MKSIAKLLLVAALLVWALQSPVAAFQSSCYPPQVYGQCMTACGSDMNSCAGRCAGNYYCTMACYAQFTGCQAGCTAQYCQ